MNIIRTVVATCLALGCAAAQEQEKPQPTATFVELGLHESVPWTLDPEVFIDARSAKRSLDLEVDRAAILDGAIEKAQAKNKLVFWYVPRIVEGENKGRQMYRAPVLDLYAMQVLFHDPDVAALLSTRFVPVRLVLDEPLAARFDLRPLGFVEPAILVLDGRGRVVHFVERIRTFDAAWLDRLLRHLLDETGAAADASTAAGPEGALGQGRFEEAARRIEALPESGRRSYLRAVLARRQQDIPAARTALGEAKRLGGPAPADLAAESIRLDLAEGRLEPGDSPPSGDGIRAAEAAYLHALAAWWRGEAGAARDGFAAVASRWPDDMFGRRARANVEVGPDDRPYGAAFSGFEPVHPLPDWAFEGAHRDTLWHGPERSDAEVARRGVEFLLSMQRETGGFQDSRYAYWPSPRITPNAWIAITALAATALLEHRDVAPDRVDDALRRAEDYMFDPAHLNRGDNEDVYADTYRLLYLSRRHQGADDGARAALVARMHAIIEEAGTRQRESGFFAHEYENAFCTAAMLWGLRLAEGAGAQVPPEMFSRGVAALVSARLEDGAFAYSGTAARRKSSVKDSSARMPVCEGMLFELGQSDPERLRAAFDAYWDNLARIEQVRRNDFHSDGELGGFFFFHSLFHASELIRLLPDELRAEGTARMRAVLQRIPEMDGSFVDSHEIGRSYGTAMALLTLANVRED
ncbi:MAG: hypothetical protein O3C51_16040 [Planctomycetota bacterium]|nr:hypothetical protein [Planctomycetota bacterium]